MNEKNCKVLAAQIRLETLKVIHSRGFGHVGGSMDLADLMAVLYGEVMKFDPKNPRWEDRDWMVLSKGHAGPALYAALALRDKVLSIRRNDVQLKPGEHFDAEIIGMNVYNYFPHTYIGTVVDVLSYPAHKLYKVKGEEKTYLIPAVKDIFITDIDEESREISVHMIEGLETDED